MTEGIISLSPWASWLLMGIIIIVAIWLSVLYCRYWLDYHIKRSNRMVRMRFCLMCQEKSEQPLGTACPHCKQGFIVEGWRLK